MHRISAAVLLLAAAPLVAQTRAAATNNAAPTTDADRDAVVKLVTEAYVDGVHNFRNPDAVRKGFHPGFEMLILRDGTLDKLPIYNWIASLEARQRKDGPVPADAPRTTEARFPLVDITGDAAIVKVELLREGKLIFTDYLQLYRFPQGWQIVGKSYFRHAS